MKDFLFSATLIVLIALAGCNQQKQTNTGDSDEAFSKLLKISDANDRIIVN